MRVIRVVLDDWVGLYVDGKLQYENHSISDYDWMSLLTAMGADCSDKEVTEEQLEEFGGLLPATEAEL